MAKKQESLLQLKAVFYDQRPPICQFTSGGLYKDHLAPLLMTSVQRAPWSLCHYTWIARFHRIVLASSHKPTLYTNQQPLRAQLVVISSLPCDLLQHGSEGGVKYVISTCPLPGKDTSEPARLRLLGCPYMFLAPGICCRERCALDLARA